MTKDHNKMMKVSIGRRKFLRRTVATGPALVLGELACAAQSQATEPTGLKGRQKPNLLVIVADDMGYADAGCYGGEIGTRNVDRLAAHGIRFTQCYSTGPCWPSRTSLLTGYYPQQVRMDPPRGRLPAWTRVVPHYLKPLGYRCYHSGKWHLLGAPKPVADGRFDRSYVLHDHDRFFAPKNHELDDQKLPSIQEGTGFYVTTALANYAVDFLKEHAETSSTARAPSRSFAAINRILLLHRDRPVRIYVSVPAGQVQLTHLFACTNTGCTRAE